MSIRNSEGYLDLTAATAIATVTREEQAARHPENVAVFRPLVYVCSPYRGDTEFNVKRAKGYCRFVIRRNAVPFAPHLLYPQFLNDNDKNERETGLKCGMEILRRCDQIWVFGETVSEGMAQEIAAAKQCGTVIRYFTSQCDEVNFRW
jgi:hypothetical protein